MAPVTKITPKTKPLKPYRRGETLGKASRAGKVAKAGPSPANLDKSISTAPTSASTPVADDKTSQTELAATLPSEKEGEVRKRGKKGKKFVDSQESMLAMISSITAEKDSVKKAKLKKVKAGPNAADLERQKKLREERKRKEFDAAKAAVRARKSKKAAPTQGEDDNRDGDTGRKRVSFA